MSQEPTTDGHAPAAVSEIKQCRHCGIYWLPPQYHDCIERIHADLAAMTERAVKAESDINAAWDILTEHGHIVKCSDIYVQANGYASWRASLSAQLNAARADLDAMTERAETAEAHIDEACEVMKERDKLRAELAAMTERAVNAEMKASELTCHPYEPSDKCGGCLECLIEQASAREANANADIRRLHADLAAMTERATTAEYWLQQWRSACKANREGSDAAVSELTAERDAARAEVASLSALVRHLERELTDLRLDVWGQYALDMGDGWQSDGALSTLESIADDLMESGVFEMHQERPWYRVRVSPNTRHIPPATAAGNDGQQSKANEGSDA